MTCIKQDTNSARYRVSVYEADTENGTRARIVVEDTAPNQKSGTEILALRLEPNGQWITEGTIDQSKKGNLLFIAAVHDSYSGKMFCDLDVRFPYDFREAAELARCIAEAFSLTQGLDNLAKTKSKQCSGSSGDDKYHS